MRLTASKLDRIMWLAHRLSRADAKHKRSPGFAHEGHSLEADLMDELRPHLVKVLRLARSQVAKTTPKGKRK